MKNLIYTATILFLITFLTSCNESFLETTPTDTYTEVIFWNTEADALSAINGCYNSFYRFDDEWRFENATPNAFNEAGEINLATGHHDAGNERFFKDVWAANYEGIGRTNSVLAKIDQIEMDENLKQRIKGEALFLRAFCYANLLNYYGGVPLILDPPKIEQSDFPRNGKDEVIQQIVSDFDSASDLLPSGNSYSGSDVGRASKGAALGMKARVLLYESRWGEAAEAAKKVMDLGDYSLFPDYRGFYLPENQNNDEVIFDRQYMIPESDHSMDRQVEHQLNMNPIQNLIDDYLMIDGMSIEDSPLYDPDNPYDNRDPRLINTIAVPGKMFRGEILDAEVFRAKYWSTGYTFKKLTQYKDDVIENDIYPSDLNFIILRYADILLMYAEAQNEVSGPDVSVYDAMHKIRFRAGMPDVTSGLTKEEMREVIRHERRIELAGEALYYNDIRRWRTAEVVNNGNFYDIDGDVVQSRTFNPARDYLWPIHIDIIQENPALEQNPGY
ncbi:MAG: RagB/SusD family nutrient uptake outer membrane protein [Prolixibacteraceae bacterium]|jgi:starch-binding outer membrane protein, SusD/RagB family|nr:RagB/SusD family nutrient uptake outer membrane protein [Prolixibacteraceae bacterium]MBT6045938.1 RagB/SusD family nutrient uptake outer membrane protein [Candidatus Scalindua sp.]MBT6765321.1 RagB/SusD family nutrient uptake outer membrane protein [Prolixibacteraceae bacterium]MBT6999897.1 RagB/SusD family nutrient uptake outer membrane protein [Prolixibacteraceae bacterium]MBT7396592.1 RagB/SusD family nutrient uptake outer membrane protein [Prolixibacteraceae bacterium]